MKKEVKVYDCGYSCQHCKSLQVFSWINNYPRKWLGQTKENRCEFCEQITEWTFVEVVDTTIDWIETE